MSKKQMIGFEKLYLSNKNGTYVKTTMKTDTPAKMFHQTNMENKCLYCDADINNGGLMTTSTTDYPIYINVKDELGKNLYYISEESKALTTCKSLIEVSIDDDFSNELCYLPVVKQYVLNGNKMYWMKKPELSTRENKFPAMSYQYFKTIK